MLAKVLLINWIKEFPSLIFVETDRGIFKVSIAFIFIDYTPRIIGIFIKIQNLYLWHISDDLVIIFVKAGMMRHVTTFILMEKLAIRGDKLMKMDTMDTLMIYPSDPTKVSEGLMILWNLTSNFLFLVFFGNVRNVLETFETALRWNGDNFCPLFVHCPDFLVSF